jgi:AcrR family transcriptional regulator
MAKEHDIAADGIAEDAVLDAALALAAERGWRAVTAADVATRAGLDAAALPGPGAFRARLLVRLADRVDLEMRAGLDADATDLDLPVRDRLFDALMARLDALAPRRDGVLAILRGLPCDPPSALAALPLLARSMARTLEAIGESPLPPFGPLKVKGLAAVWLTTLRAWRTDDSADMAVTMKALDAALARAEEAANSFLPRVGGRPTRSEAADRGAHP